MTRRLQIGEGPLPLVVGVTGHRDLATDAIPKIIEEVRRLFASLNERYPSTPVIILSALAEGADRIVARTAIECGAKLCSVLPMPGKMYERDFTSPESLREFRGLLAESYDSIVVSTGEHTESDARHPGPARDDRYANAGAFVVRYSQILIALWDGNSDEILGGTAQIVRFALQGVPPHYLSRSREALHSDETGAVYHIRSIRELGEGEEAKTSVSTRWLYPHAEIPEEGAKVAAKRAFEASLNSLNRFNYDTLTAPIAAQVARSAELLFSSSAARELKMESSALGFTRSLFGKADALALRCRNLTHGVMIALFSTIWIAITVFSVYSDLYTNFWILYAIFAGFVVCAFGLDLGESRSRLQERFQDYRALAEGVRVQFYWQLAGITNAVYDHYLARQEGELDWIRNAMRAATLQPPREAKDTSCNGESSDVLKVILSQWVRGEASYFASAMNKERRMAWRIKLSSAAFLILAGVTGIVLAAALFANATGFRNGLIAILEVALVSAGLLTGYAQKRAHEEHARRYHRMWLLYRIAAERIELCLERSNLSGARSLLVQLGREALAENCDWLILHRERQIDVPTG